MLSLRFPSKDVRATARWVGTLVALGIASLAPVFAAQTPPPAGNCRGADPAMAALTSFALPTPRIDIPLSPDGASSLPEGWSLQGFAGKASVIMERVGPVVAVHLRSDRSAFALHRGISMDVRQYPYLSWAWRVDCLPLRGDARRRETDDQAAQVYIVFPRFPAMVRSQIVGYIWDSTAPVGAAIQSPSSPMAKLIVVRSGTDRLGQWLAETRNMREDYQRLFGGTPPAAGRISLLINSQFTGSTAESWFAGLAFTQHPPERGTGWPENGAEDTSPLGRAAPPVRP